MAEAIGVGASVLGILSAAAKVTHLSMAIRDAYKDAPKLLTHIEAEIAAVDVAVRGIQRLMVQASEDDAKGGDGSTSTDRKDPLIPQESLIMMLTHSVMTFSTLEELLVKFHAKKRGGLLSVGLLLRRTTELKEMLGRLQEEKLSLCLLLQVANSEREEERKQDMIKLAQRLERLLAKDENMATRSLCASYFSSPMEDHDTASIRQSIKSSRTMKQRESRSFARRSFESLLQKSFPYRRAITTEDEILDSSSSHILSPSIFFENISLCKISELSVFALPLWMDEITNSYHYNKDVASDSTGEPQHTSTEALEGSKPIKPPVGKTNSSPRARRRVVKPQFERAFLPNILEEKSESAKVARNKELEKQIRTDKMRMMNDIRLLLVAGDEGLKNEFMHHLRMISPDGSYSITERLEWGKAIIYELESYLGTGSDTLMAITGGDALMAIAKAIGSINDPTQLKVLNEDMKGAATKEIRESAHSGTLSALGFLDKLLDYKEGGFPDGFLYFLQPATLSRVVSPGYAPTNADILAASPFVEMPGVQETMLDLGRLRYRISSIGASQMRSSSRKKWMHSFEGVHVLLCVVSLMSYKRSLPKDLHANEMQEELMSFEALVNSQWFIKTPCVLFFTDTSEFKSALLKDPLRIYFPDYIETQDWESSVYFSEQEYLLDAFKRVNRNPDRDIYCHCTERDNYNNLRMLMASVQVTILQKNLQNLILK